MSCRDGYVALFVLMAAACSGASSVAGDGGSTPPATDASTDAGGDATIDARADGAADSSTDTVAAEGAPADGHAGDVAQTDARGDAQGDANAAWWQPGTGPLPWQWEIDHEINTASALDMGTGDTTYTGAPAAAPVVYDIDGFNNTAADVAALHAMGKKVIAYIEVGAAESYRPDYAQFPVADLGSTVSGYPNEKYLDINDAAVVTVIEARIAMCAQKGFDAIEPDIDDSYTDTTGFSISEAQNIAYLATLSDYAHSLGLAWGLKNGGDGGDPPSFVAGVLPHVDFAVVEEPFFLHTIAYFEPAFSSAGKALFVAEYTNDTASASTFCPQAIMDLTNAALFDVALDAMVRDPCQ
jgi:hypothetical protein